MIASSQGGMNIEEVAAENPDAIVTEPVDILTGFKREQGVKIAKAVGFTGDSVEQVIIFIRKNGSHFLSYLHKCK